MKNIIRIFLSVLVFILLFLIDAEYRFSVFLKKKIKKK